MDMKDLESLCRRRGFIFQSARSEAAAAHPSDFFRSHETRVLQHSDVLLHSRRRDVERVGQLGDAGI